MNLSPTAFKGIFKSASAFLSKNSPAIAAGVAIAGMGLAIYSAIKATPKAELAITRASVKDKSDGSCEYIELSKLEKAKIYGRYYAPTFALALLSAVCMIGSVYLANKQTKTMAVLCAAAEASLADFKDSAKEIVGEGKTRKIEDDARKKRFEKMQDAQGDYIFETGHGNTLICDSISGRLFRSDIEFIKGRIDVLNERLPYEEFIPLNTYYDDIGLDGTKYGDEQGWHYNPESYARNGGKIEYEITSMLTRDGHPAAYIDIKTAPKFDWSDLDC